MKVVVYLGRGEFHLIGLTSAQHDLVSAAWGPFLDPVAAYEAEHRAASTSLWALVFFPTAPPSGASLSFQRGTDVAIQRVEAAHDHLGHPRQYTLNCWIDGSFGSIEASLQVALQWALLEQGGLLVHSSAGVWRGEGWLIPGPSGAGKSTSVRVGGFDEVLSDELVIVLPSLDPASSAPFTLLSTPFWSEGRSMPLIVRAAPLDRITFPVKSSSVSLVPCTSIDAITQIVPTLTLYELENSPQRGELFNIACTLCESTPSYWLHFPKLGPWLSALDEIT